MSMVEQILAGSHRYKLWIGGLLLVVLAGLLCYLQQLSQGLVITGLGRDVTWGLYIAQFTFFVGIAASAVTVVLPYYLHDYKQFARLTILGELLAITAVIMSGLFILVDLGQPSRVLNIVLHPQPQSVMFWDLIALSGYFLLNVVIATGTINARREHVPTSGWIRTLALISIPWAISIHTVTAFLFSGLPGRSYWLTAILAPRFLASAFASGPALLILLCFIARKLTGFDVGNEALHKLAVIITYAAAINVFFVLAEVFSAFYSEIPEYEAGFVYLFVGMGGDRHLVPWMWLSFVLSLAALVLLLVPRWRSKDRLLAAACLCIFVSIWLEKGLGLIIGGMVPSPLGTITRYAPTLPEWTIVLGIWAIGALMTTAFFKTTFSIWESNGGD
ncbi:DsrP [Candidatus Sulfotelmatobacter kueseliae]|uniref:DsrP n=1 Tax=Candidatus Sulfotelmatobacter kueseliae TaxID=2042962 RepID=A0A2U3JXU5_9BACT|nr:DsrP [Candidatus Sulfotelmatobacter kueseliae]